MERRTEEEWVKGRKDRRKDGWELPKGWGRSGRRNRAQHRSQQGRGRRI